MLNCLFFFASAQTDCLPSCVYAIRASLEFKKKIIQNQIKPPEMSEELGSDSTSNVNRFASQTN